MLLGIWKIPTGEVETNQSAPSISYFFGVLQKSLQIKALLIQTDSALNFFDKLSWNDVGIKV